MEKTLKVARQELKFLTNEIDKRKLSSDLKSMLIGDKHNGMDGYNIRSLYFDNYANTDFYEKMDGVEVRKKIRLRIYSPDDAFAKLEIKRKNGNDQIKSSVLISKEDAIELIKCNYDVLLKYKSSSASTIYNIMKVNHLIPVVLIEYKREAFLHEMNDIRITLDSNIRSSETNFNLFDKNLILTPLDDDVTLVEVKYNGYLLNWINMILAKYDLTRLSFSKYSTSRSIFENYLG